MTACLPANGKDPVERKNGDIHQRGKNFQTEFLALMKGIVD